MSNKPNMKPKVTSRVLEAQAAQKKPGTPWWIFAAVGVVVVVALVAAVVVSTRSSDSTAPTSIKGGGTVVPAGELAYGDVKVTGTPLPAQPDSGPDPAIGKTVPELQGEQFDGRPITIPVSGKPKVVMFVAHWCPHCQKEVPLVTAELASKGLPTDVDLFAVATSTSDQRPNFPPSAWLQKAGWPVPTLLDDNKGTAANAYGVGGFPFFVAVDAKGAVVDRQSGELTMEQFQKLIDEARRGTVT